MRLIVFLLACFSLLQLSAQTTVRGTVVDPSGQVVEFATVALGDPTTDQILEAVTTDLEGVFEMTTSAENFYVEVTLIGFIDQRIEDFTLANGTVELGEITLRENSELLEEVVVTAEQSSTEFKLDKRVFNVGKDLGARGGSALNLLDNVPSVQVDVEGNVTLRGNAGVRILINGRPSGLVGDGGQGLRSLTADMVESVEVITNPSARYEAEGASGIINIVLKKDQRTGLNGSFDATVGLPESYGVAANLNYRSGRLNWFTNYGINRRSSIGGGTLRQELYTEDGTLLTLQNGDRDRSGLNHNFRLGADYFFNDKTTLTLAGRYNTGEDNNVNTTEYLDFFDGDFLSRIVRTDLETEDEQETEVSLAFRKEFQEKDRLWTADIRFQDETESEGSDLTNVLFPDLESNVGATDLLQRSANVETNRNLIFQTDYVHPIGEDGRAEGGIRVGLRDITNDFGVDDFIGGEYQPRADLTNEFFYNENIYAAYLIYGNKSNNFSYQFGLRPEYTDVVTELKTTAEINARDYLNFFPSVNFGYEFTEKSSVQLSYSRRVNRPRFRSLNPFFTFSDDRNFYSGNPDLDPEFSNNLEAGYLRIFGEGSLYGAVYYRATTGVIERVQRVDAEGNSITRPENLATQQNAGVELNGNYRPNKWLRLNTDFNFFYEEVNGGAEFPNLNAETFTWFTRGTAQFEVDKKTEGQLRFNYRAPRKTTQGERLAVWTVDLAASRDVLAGNGTITLSVRDLFNTRRWRSITFGEDFFRENDFQWRGTTANLSFNYRLNQKKQRSRGGRGGYDGGEEGF